MPPERTPERPAPGRPTGRMVVLRQHARGAQDPATRTCNTATTMSALPAIGACSYRLLPAQIEPSGIFRRTVGASVEHVVHASEGSVQGLETTMTLGRIDAPPPPRGWPDVRSKW